MDLALDNLQGFICHKTQPINDDVQLNCLYLPKSFTMSWMRHKVTY